MDYKNHKKIFFKLIGGTVAVIFFITSSVSAAPLTSTSPLTSTLRPQAAVNAGPSDLTEALIESGTTSTDSSAALTDLPEKEPEKVSIPKGAVTKDVILIPKLGMHLRLIEKIVTKAEKFPRAKVFIVKEGQRASCRTIMELLMLGASKGAKLTVYATDEQKKEALWAIAEMLETEEVEAEVNIDEIRRKLNERIKELMEIITDEKSELYKIECVAEFLAQLGVTSDLFIQSLEKAISKSKYHKEALEPILQKVKDKRNNTFSKVVTSKRLVNELVSDVNTSHNNIASFGILMQSPGNASFASASYVKSQKVEIARKVDGVLRIQTGMYSGIHAWELASMQIAYDRTVEFLENLGFKGPDRSKYTEACGYQISGTWELSEDVSIDGITILGQDLLSDAWLRGTISGVPAQKEGFLKLDEPAEINSFMKHKLNKSKITKKEQGYYEDLLVDELIDAILFLSKEINPNKKLILDDYIRKLFSSRGVKLPEPLTLGAFVANIKKASPAIRILVESDFSSTNIKGLSVSVKEQTLREYSPPIPPELPEVVRKENLRLKPLVAHTNNKPTILVTGGAGFIGSNFVRYILNKHPDYKVIVLDRLFYTGRLENMADFMGNPNFEFIEGDVQNKELVNRIMKRVDAVVHFAAETHVDRSIDDSLPFVDSNVRGTSVLLEATRRQKRSIRFVYVSTDEVYGAQQKGQRGRFSEESPLEPHSPYSAAKGAAELLVKSFKTTHGLGAIILRLTNNYGPYQYPEKMLPLFITNALGDKPLPVYGKGENIRDWLSVWDTARAVDIALHNGKEGETYNVAGGNKHHNRDIARKILDILGRPRTLIKYVADRPGHDFKYNVDDSKIRKELRWRPIVNFDKELKRTIDWYVENRDWWYSIKFGEILNKIPPAKDSITKCVTFDWGKVLDEYDYGIATRKLAEWCGADEGLAYKYFEERNTNPDNPLYRYERRKIDERGLREETNNWLRQIGAKRPDLTQEEITELYTCPLIGDIPESLALVQALIEKGYKVKILAVTNNIWHQRRLRESKFPKILKNGIKDIHASHQRRWTKPYYRAYIAVLNDARVSPEQGMYVNDRQDCLDGAIRAGLNVAPLFKTKDPLGSIEGIVNSLLKAATLKKYLDAIPPASESPFKLLIFDQGNVVCRYDYEKIADELHRRFGIDKNIALDFLEERNTNPANPLYQYEHDMISLKDFVAAVKAWLKNNLGQEVKFTEKDYRRIFVEKVYIGRIPETVALIKALKHKGYKIWGLATLSDVHLEYTSDPKNRIGLPPLLEKPEHFHGSCKREYAKPHPQSYLDITDEARVEPHQAIMIDDREDCEKGAKDAGLWTNLFNPGNPLESVKEIVEILSAEVKSSSAGKMTAEALFRDAAVTKARAKSKVKDAFRYGQEHIFEYWNELSHPQKELFLSDVKQIDFKKVDEYYKDCVLAKTEELIENIIPEEPINEEEAVEKYGDKAEKALQEGQLAVYLLAGGDARRLGFEGPKGMFEASPLSGKTLYQIFVEKVKVLSKKYGKPLPLIIQTSRNNYQQTLEYFEENNYFGIKEQIQIELAIQRAFPVLDKDGKILMKSKSSIHLVGFGHGDATDYVLKKQSVRNWLKKFGTKYVQVAQIDNPLGPIGHKGLLGAHIASYDRNAPKEKVHMTYTLVDKKPPTEKVPIDHLGHLGFVDGERKTAEYSKISQETTDLFKVGGPNILILTLDSLDGAEPLTPEFTIKGYKNEEGNTVDVYKFELFIFSHPSYGSSVRMERNDVFAPIKNRERDKQGRVVEESLLTSQAIQSFSNAQVLRKLGWNLPDRFPISDKKYPEVEAFYPYAIEFSEAFAGGDEGGVEAKIGRNGHFKPPQGALFVSGVNTRIGNNITIEGGLYIDVEDEWKGTVLVENNVTFKGDIRIKVYGSGILIIPEGTVVTQDIIVFDGETLNYGDIEPKTRRSYEIEKFTEMTFKTKDARKAAVEFLRDGVTVIKTNVGWIGAVVSHPRDQKRFYRISFYKHEEPQQRFGYHDFEYVSDFWDARRLITDVNLSDECPDDYCEGMFVEPEYRNKGLGTKLILFAQTFGAFHGVRFHEMKAPFYLGHLGYEMRTTVGFDGSNLNIPTADLRKFATLPQREELDGAVSGLPGGAAPPDGTSARSSSAGKSDSAANPNKWPHILKLKKERVGLVISYAGADETARDIFLSLGPDFAKWRIYHFLKDKGKIESKGDKLPAIIPAQDLRKWDGYDAYWKSVKLFSVELFEDNLSGDFASELKRYGYRYRRKDDTFVLSKPSVLRPFKLPHPVDVDKVVGVIKEHQIPIPDERDPAIFSPHVGRGQSAKMPPSISEGVDDAQCAIRYLNAYNKLIKEPTVKNLFLATIDPNTSTGPYTDTMFYILEHGISEEFLSLLHVTFYIHRTLFGFSYSYLNKCELIDLWFLERILEKFCQDNYPDENCDFLEKQTTHGPEGSTRSSSAGSVKDKIIGAVDRLWRRGYKAVPSGKYITTQRGLPHIRSFRWGSWSPIKIWSAETGKLLYLAYVGGQTKEDVERRKLKPYLGNPKFEATGTEKLEIETGSSFEKDYLTLRWDDRGNIAPFAYTITDRVSEKGAFFEKFEFPFRYVQLGSPDYFIWDEIEYAIPTKTGFPLRQKDILMELLRKQSDTRPPDGRELKIIEKVLNELEDEFDSSDQYSMWRPDLLKPLSLIKEIIQEAKVQILPSDNFYCVIFGGTLYVDEKMFPSLTPPHKEIGYYDIERGYTDGFIYLIDSLNTEVDLKNKWAREKKAIKTSSAGAARTSEPFKIGFEPFGTEIEPELKYLDISVDDFRRGIREAFYKSLILTDTLRELLVKPSFGVDDIKNVKVKFLDIEEIISRVYLITVKHRYGESSFILDVDCCPSIEAQIEAQISGKSLPKTYEVPPTTHRMLDNLREAYEADNRFVVRPFAKGEAKIRVKTPKGEVKDVRITMATKEYLKNWDNAYIIAREEPKLGICLRVRSRSRLWEIRDERNRFLEEIVKLFVIYYLKLNKKAIKIIFNHGDLMVYHPTIRKSDSYNPENIIVDFLGDLWTDLEGAYKNIKIVSIYDFKPMDVREFIHALLEHKDRTFKIGISTVFFYKEMVINGIRAALYDVYGKEKGEEEAKRWIAEVEKYYREKEEDTSSSQSADSNNQQEAEDPTRASSAGSVDKHAETNINLATLSKALYKANKDIKRDLNVDLVLTLGGSTELLSLAQDIVPSDKIHDIDIEVNFYGKADLQILVDEARRAINRALEGSGMEVSDKKHGQFQNIIKRSLVIDLPDGSSKEYDLDFIIKDLDRPPTPENIRASHVVFLTKRFKEAGNNIFWVRETQPDGKVVTKIIDAKKDPRKHIVRYLRNEYFFGDENIFKQVAREFIRVKNEDNLKIAEKIKDSGRVEVLTSRLRKVATFATIGRILRLSSILIIPVTAIILSILFGDVYISITQSSLLGSILLRVLTGGIARGSGAYMDQVIRGEKIDYAKIVKWIVVGMAFIGGVNYSVWYRILAKFVASNFWKVFIDMTAYTLLVVLPVHFLIQKYFISTEKEKVTWNETIRSFRNLYIVNTIYWGIGLYLGWAFWPAGIALVAANLQIPWSGLFIYLLENWIRKKNPPAKKGNVASGDIPERERNLARAGAESTETRDGSKGAPRASSAGSYTAPEPEDPIRASSAGSHAAPMKIERCLKNLEREIPKLSKHQFYPVMDTAHGKDGPPGYKVEPIKTVKEGNEIQQAAIRYLIDRGVKAGKFTDYDVENESLVVIYEGNPNHWDIKACLWEGELLNEDKLKRIYPDLIKEHAGLYKILQGEARAYESLEKKRNKIRRQIVLIGILVGESPIHSDYLIAAAYKNLKEYGLPEVAVRDIDKKTVELLLPIWVTDTLDLFSDIYKSAEKFQARLKEEFKDRVKYEVREFDKTVGWWDKWTDTYHLPVLTLPKEILPYVAELLKEQSPKLVGTKKRGTKPEISRAIKAILSQNLLVKILARVNNLSIYEIISKLIEAGLPIDKPDIIKEKDIHFNSILTAIEKAGLSTEGIRFIKHTEGLWDISSKGREFKDIRGEIKANDYVGGREGPSEMAKRLIDRVIDEVALQYGSEMHRVSFPRRGTYAYEHQNESKFTAEKTACEDFTKVCDEELKAKDHETLMDVLGALRQLQHELGEEYRKPVDVDGFIQKVIQYIGHILYEAKGAPEEIDIDSFMTQDVAARLASEAADEVDRWGISKIKAESVCRIEGRFKDGSDNRVYLVKSNIPFDWMDIKVSKESLLRLNFLIITDNKDKVRCTAVQWRRKPEEDDSEKYFVLQAQYQGVDISKENRAKILKLRRRMDFLFKDWLKDGKGIIKKPCYVQGPLIHQGELETEFDRKLKAFLSTSPIARHILSQPEFQIMEKISLSPGMYTVVDESEKLHPYGRKYNLPAGYYWEHKAILRSLLDRPIYADVRVVAIHELLHPITRSRYFQIGLSKFRTEKTRITRHLKKYHSGLWEEYLGSEQYPYWEEFINTLIPYLAIGRRKADFYILFPIGSPKEHKNRKVEEPIYREDITLLKRINLIPPATSLPRASSAGSVSKPSSRPFKISFEPHRTKGEPELKYFAISATDLREGIKKAFYQGLILTDTLRELLDKPDFCRDDILEVKVKFLAVENTISRVYLVTVRHKHGESSFILDVDCCPSIEAQIEAQISGKSLPKTYEVPPTTHRMLDNLREAYEADNRFVARAFAKGEAKIRVETLEEGVKDVRITMTTKEYLKGWDGAYIFPSGSPICPGIIRSWDRLWQAYGMKDYYSFAQKIVKILVIYYLKLNHRAISIIFANADLMVYHPKIEKCGTTSPDDFYDQLVGRKRERLTDVHRNMKAASIYKLIPMERKEFIRALLEHKERTFTLGETKIFTKEIVIAGIRDALADIYGREKGKKEAKDWIAEVRRCCKELGMKSSPKTSAAGRETAAERKAAAENSVASSAQKKGPESFLLYPNPYNPKLRLDLTDRRNFTWNKRKKRWVHKKYKGLILGNVGDIKRATYSGAEFSAMENDVAIRTKLGFSVYVFDDHSVSSDYIDDATKKREVYEKGNIQLWMDAHSDAYLSDRKHGYAPGYVAITIAEKGGIDFHIWVSSPIGTGMTGKNEAIDLLKSYVKDYEHHSMEEYFYWPGRPKKTRAIINIESDLADSSEIISFLKRLFEEDGIVPSTVHLSTSPSAWYEDTVDATGAPACYGDVKICKEVAEFILSEATLKTLKQNIGDITTEIKTTGKTPVDKDTSQRKNLVYTLPEALTVKNKKLRMVPLTPELMIKKADEFFILQNSVAADVVWTKERDVIGVAKGRKDGPIQFDPELNCSFAVLDENDAPVAVAMYSSADKRRGYAYLETFAVLPEYQGTAVASWILLHSFQEAQKQGFTYASWIAREELDETEKAHPYQNQRHSIRAIPYYEIKVKARCDEKKGENGRIPPKEETGADNVPWEVRPGKWHIAYYKDLSDLYSLYADFRTKSALCTISNRLIIAIDTAA